MLYSIFYMKPETFREFICGDVPVVDQLGATHTHLMDIEAADLDDVYHQCQGEVWSPNGEARSVIRSMGLGHTSMSVGDVIEQAGKFWVVASVGFKELAR